MTLIIIAIAISFGIIALVYSMNCETKYRAAAVRAGGEKSR